MADFHSNFVAIATRVGRGRIRQTSFISPTPKTQGSRRYLLYKPRYRLFCLEFRWASNTTNHIKWALDYVSDYQLESVCNEAPCIAPSRVTQKIFAVSVD